MMINCTQSKFQEFLLAMKRDIHVKKMKVKNFNFSIPRTATLYSIVLFPLHLGRVVNRLFNHAQCSCIAGVAKVQSAFECNLAKRPSSP